MIKKLFKRSWFVFFSLIWMLYCIFIYFFSIAKIQSSICRISDACLSIKDHSWQIVTNQSHQYYTDAFLESIGIGPSKSHVPGPILLILAGLFFLYVANLFYDRFIEKRKQLDLNLTPFSVLLIIVAIFFLLYNRWVTFFALEEPTRYRSIFVNLSIFLGQLLTIIFLSISFGRKLLLTILPNEDEADNSKLREFLFSLGFGLITIMLILFLLGLLKILLLKYILIIFGGMLLISIKSFYYWLSTFFKYKISFQANYFEASVFLLLILFLAISQNILDLIRPLPIGFDDLSVYMNNPHMMAIKGSLISGAMSYYWELFTSLGFILFNSVTSAMMISFISGIGCLLSILYLVSVYCKKRGFDLKTSRFYSILIATFFFTLPAFVFHLAKDIKVDLAGLLFTLLSLIVFWEWRDKYLEGKNKSVSYLYVCALFAGFAVAIKYTNLLFLFVLFVYLILILLKKRKTVSLRKQFVLPLLFIFFSILPVLPITVRNIVQTRSFAVANIRLGERTSREIKIDPPFASTDGIIENFDTYMTKKATGDYEEAGRYIGYDKGIKKYLLLPFRITKNAFSSSLYVDISFLFLAFVPLVLYVFIKLRKNSEAEIFKEIVILGSIYWILWTFLASGIIWYGFSGFIFLFFAIIEALHYIKNNTNRLLRVFTSILLIFWFISAIFLRLANLPKYNIGLDRGGLQYARGDITAEDNLKQKFGYLGAIEVINKDIVENPTNLPKVYRVGTFYKYVIAENDETVIDDQMLDLFAFCYQDQDDQKLIERFKNSGIKYMIVDRGMRNVDKTPEKSYVKKYDQFETMIKNNASKYFGIMSDSSDEKMFIIRIY